MSASMLQHGPLKRRFSNAGRRALPPLLLAASVAAMGVLASAPTRAAGTLNVAIHQDPGSWDPTATFLVAWAGVGSNLFDGLLMRTPDMKLVAGLATKWEFLDDNKRLRFTLREGVKFHDGEPFDANAVKFTFDRLLGDVGKKGPQQSNYKAIERVEVIDAHTVDMHLKYPDPVLLTKLAGYGAMIVPPKYIQEKGDAHFAMNPVGTGPFRFVEYRPKTGIKLARNDEYWGTKPRLDGIDYRIITEPATQAAELQAGRLDVANQIPLSLTKTIKDNKALDVVSLDGPTTVSLRFDTTKGLTKDVNVRKAIIMAIDRDSIVKSILMGHAKPIASFQGALSFGNDPSMKPLPFDPAKAKQMLAKAGVKPGATLDLSMRGSDSNFREVSQAVAAYLQAVGLTVTLKPYDTNVLLNDIIPNGKTGAMWQSSWGGWTFDYDNTAYSMYHSGEKWNPYEKDEKLDAMLEKQRSVWDPKQREPMLQEIARYVADRALEVPLYSVNTVYGVNHRAKSLELPSDGRFRFVNASVE